MRIGELARRAGVNIQTIRFYEREGFLPEPERLMSGYRAYQDPDLERVLVIRQFQGLGFTLADIRDVFELHQILAARRHPGEMKASARGEMLARARARLDTIEDKLAALTGMKGEMLRLIDTLASDGEPVCTARPRAAAG
jgi:MerR family transcriptional regulator, copper efflux regulator